MRRNVSVARAINTQYIIWFYCCYYFPSKTNDLAAAFNCARDDVAVVVNEAEAFGNGVQIIAI